MYRKVNLLRPGQPRQLLNSLSTMAAAVCPISICNPWSRSLALDHPRSITQRGLTSSAKKSHLIPLPLPLPLREEQVLFLQDTTPSTASCFLSSCLSTLRRGRSASRLYVHLSLSRGPDTNWEDYWGLHPRIPVVENGLVTQENHLNSEEEQLSQALQENEKIL